MSPKVVIVGAGYAGISAAKRLARGAAKVTMVNPRADFVERIRLHQLVAGTHSARLPLRSLLPASVTLLQGVAESVDTERGTLALTDGESVGFDYLIYAVGSRSRLDAVPGASEHAVTVGGLAEAYVTRERIADLSSGSSITIVGGGLTGVELAAELAELNNHAVRLVTDGPIAASVSDNGRDYIRQYLSALGVELLEHTAVSEVQEAKIVLADGRTLRSELSVLTAMFEVPTLARDSGLDVGTDDTLRVDRSLVSTSQPRVVGAGDASRIDGAPLRMSCQAALPLGAHAAETVLRLIEGVEPKPVRPKFTGQCISLGRRSALWQHSNLSDAATPFTVRGKPAAWIKGRICAASTGIVLNPKLAHLSYSWS